jgi:hypothetical protein
MKFPIKMTSTVSNAVVEFDSPTAGIILDKGTNEFLEEGTYVKGLVACTNTSLWKKVGSSNEDKYPLVLRHKARTEVHIVMLDEDTIIPINAPTEDNRKQISLEGTHYSELGLEIMPDDTVYPVTIVHDGKTFTFDTLYTGTTDEGDSFVGNKTHIELQEALDSQEEEGSQMFEGVQEMLSTLKGKVADLVNPDKDHHYLAFNGRTGQYERISLEGTQILSIETLDLETVEGMAAMANGELNSTH